MKRIREETASRLGAAVLCVAAMSLTSPQTSFAGSSTAQVQLDLDVQALCMFSTATHTMNLGGYSGLQDVTGSVDIGIDCNGPAVDWTLHASLGSNTTSCLDRKLADTVSGDTLTYSLSPVPSHAVPICEGPNDGVGGTGSWTLPLYGKIATSAGTVIDGATYSDSVILTLSF